MCLVFGSWNACASSKDCLKSCQWVQGVTSSPKLEENWKHLCLSERDFPVSVLAFGANPHWGCLNHTVKPKLSSVYGSSLILKDHNSAVLLPGELLIQATLLLLLLNMDLKAGDTLNLHQLSSWENCHTNCVIKKPSFAQSFSEPLEQLCRDPRAFWTSCQRQEHQWKEGTLHPGYSKHMVYFPAASVLMWLLLYQLRSLEPLWHQTSLVERPWQQPCASGPCVLPTAQTVSLQLLHWMPVDCKSSWMMAIAEKTWLVHSSTGGASEEYSEGFQPGGSWTVTPLKSPWVSHGHSQE